MERLNYFVHNPQILTERFYNPLLKHFLQGLAEESLELVLDTSMLWDKFYLIEVCLIWGGRSISLVQVVLKHGSTTVGFDSYRPVLDQVLPLLPLPSSIT